MDGPVVLAALTDKEPELLSEDAVTPEYEHQCLEGRDWRSGHFLARIRQGALAVGPLYEIADESYCVYFASLL